MLFMVNGSWLRVKGLWFRISRFIIRKLIL